MSWNYKPVKGHGSGTDGILRVISRHQNSRLTYDGLHQRSTALAHGLRNLGVKKGDRVAVSLGNNVEFAIVWSLRRSSRLLN